MKKRLVAGLMLAAGILASVKATNYYVSIDGNDDNDGSKGAPFRSLAKATSMLFAGDTCFVMEGVYRETLVVGRNGSAEAPIVFKAFENDSVVISATEPVEGWTQHEASIYRTSAHMNRGISNRLYFDSKAMEWARWPNNTDDNRFTIDASPVEGGSASTVIDNAIPDLDWTGGYMWYLGAHSGCSWTRPVTGYDAASHTLSFTAVDISKWPYDPHNPTVYRNGNRGRIYLFGVMDALDYPGEWYFDKDKDSLYFRAPGDVDPAGHLTEIAVRTNAMQLSGDHVHVDGINAFGGQILISGDHCVLRDGHFLHCGELQDGLETASAQLNMGSVKVEGSYTLIEDNVIDWSISNGIAMISSWKGSKNNTVHNNVIRNINTIGNHSCGIRSSCPSTRVIGNSIYHCGRDGVYVSGINSEIAWNDIYYCMHINNDGGVFYTVGNSSSKNTEIHHNWCHDSYGPHYADGRAAGIYLDNDSKGYDVHHNVVWNVTWAALQMNWDNWYNNIVNNSYWQVGEAMGNWLNGRVLIDNTIQNNYSSTGPWIGNEFVTNIIDSHDPFNDAGARDFTPNKGSVLIDAGTAFEGITTQVLGTAPDVGAYEYGLSPWKPGVNRIIGGDTLSNLRVAFISPVSGQVFAQPAEILVEAANVNEDEGVHMSLYLDEVLVGTDSVAPYSWTPEDYPVLSGLGVGKYELVIHATDVNDYAASARSSFEVIAASPGDSFHLGNEAREDGEMEVWPSNMVINETDLYINRTDSLMYLRVDSFSFYAGALADPVTPFIVKVNGDDDFTVLSIGTSRVNTEYLEGANCFAFRDGGDTTLVLEPSDTIAVGFLDAFANGSGGGLGPVIPYTVEDPADEVWYTGGPAGSYSGSVSEGQAPVFKVNPRLYYLKNYLFDISFTLWDTVYTRPVLVESAFTGSIMVYPNPVSGSSITLQVSGMDLPANLHITDMQGRLVYGGRMEESTLHLEAGILSRAGTYVVRIACREGVIYRKLLRL